MNKIKKILNSIEISLKSESYYCALISSLMIPDLCGQIEFPNMNSKERYIAWFKKYLNSKYNQKGYNNGVDFLIPENCYALRCSMLHEGKSDISNQKSKAGNLNQIHFHTNKFDRGHCNLNCDNIEGLQLNVERFCCDIIESAREWLKDIKNDDVKIEKINLILEIKDI